MDKMDKTFLIAISLMIFLAVVVVVCDTIKSVYSPPAAVESTE